MTSRVLWLGLSVLGSAGIHFSSKITDPCDLCASIIVYVVWQGAAGCANLISAITGFLIFLFRWFLGLNLPVFPIHRARFCSLLHRGFSRQRVDPCVPWLCLNKVPSIFCWIKQSCFALPLKPPRACGGGLTGGTLALPRQVCHWGSRCAWAGLAEDPGGCAGGRNVATYAAPVCQSLTRCQHRVVPPVFALPGCVPVLYYRVAVGLFLLLGSSSLGAAGWDATLEQANGVFWGRLALRRTRAKQDCLASAFA